VGRSFIILYSYYLDLYRIFFVVIYQLLIFLTSCFYIQSEGSAMMQYLCDKYSWDQWWPQGSDDLSRQKRAKLSEYLSYHHHGTRMISHKIVFKIFSKQFFKKEYEESKEDLRNLSFKIVANFEKKGLGAGPFIGGSPTPTIADLFAYAEIYQLVYLDIFSHEELSPAMQTWAEALQTLPAHDDVHASLAKLAAAVKAAEEK
jgi:glutathione S-transferase